MGPRLDQATLAAGRTSDASPVRGDQRPKRAGAGR